VNTVLCALYSSTALIRHKHYTRHEETRFLPCAVTTHFYGTTRVSARSGAVEESFVPSAETIQLHIRMSCRISGRSSFYVS
jgi:hypothetical protein